MAPVHEGDLIELVQLHLLTRHHLVEEHLDVAVRLLAVRGLCVWDERAAGVQVQNGGGGWRRWLVGRQVAWSRSVMVGAADA